MSVRVHVCDAAEVACSHDAVRSDQPSWCEVERLVGDEALTEGAAGRRWTGRW